MYLRAMKNISFCVAIFLYSSFLISQNSIEQREFNLDSLRFFSSTKSNLQLIFNSSVVLISDSKYSLEPIAKIEKSFFYELNNSNFDVVKDSTGSQFFVRKQLGEVFTFQNNAFKQIDLSGFLNSNAGSSKLFYNNALYSLFGNGYFKENNLILRYDLKAREWSKVNPSLDSDIPKARTNAIVKKIDDQLYILGGNYQNNSNQTVYVRDLYLFNLLTNKVTKIGDLTDLFNFNTLNQIIEIDKYRSVVLKRDKLILIDFKNLTYDAIDYSKNAIDFTYSQKLEDKIYYLKSDDSKFQINSIELENLLSKFKNPKSLLKDNYFSFSKMVYLILLLGFILSFYIFSRAYNLRKFKLKSILKQANYITYKNFILPLDYEESEVIDFLILKKKVTLSAIFELPCFNEYSDSYKKIYIPKLIKELNEKFNLQVPKKFKLSLEKNKNKIDKRILEISLKGEIIPYKGWISYVFKL